MYLVSFSECNDRFILVVGVFCMMQKLRSVRPKGICFSCGYLNCGLLKVQVHNFKQLTLCCFKQHSTCHKGHMKSNVLCISYNVSKLYVRQFCKLNYSNYGNT
jgi:hypothetical protein